MLVYGDNKLTWSDQDQKKASMSSLTLELSIEEEVIWYGNVILWVENSLNAPDKCATMSSVHVYCPGYLDPSLPLPPRDSQSVAGVGYSQPVSQSLA